MIAALLQTMEDQGNQRVQAHAAAALINFTEDCPKSLLIPYLDNLVKHLHSIMVLKLQEVSPSDLRHGGGGGAEMMLTNQSSDVVNIWKTMPPFLCSRFCF